MPYKQLLKKLHKKYPGKHIAISETCNCFDHDGLYYKAEYGLYVEGAREYQHFPTFKEMKTYINNLCEREG